MRISRRTVLTRVKNENKLLFNKRQPSRVIYPVKTGIIRQTDYWRPVSITYVLFDRSKQ